MPGLDDDDEHVDALGGPAAEMLDAGLHVEDRDVVALERAGGA